MAVAGKYYQQLDGLRALAVGAVLFHHWFGELGHSWTRAAHEGAHGVTLFFVLSGFLITEILLNARQKLPQLGLWSVLRTFYIRRTFRIFPIYYLYIGACLVAYPALLQSVWWYLSYTFNLQLWLTAFNPASPEGNWLVPALAHTWTLCIEEQFYLFWPLLILTVPQRYLWHFIIGTLVFSLGFHFYSLYVLKNYASERHTISAMFALVAGAGLALAKRQGLGLPYPQLMLPLTLGVYMLFHFPIDAVDWPGRNFVMAEGRLPVLLSLYLVYGAYTGFRGWFGHLLSSKPMVTIGRVSYGIYLYHLVIPFAFDDWNKAYGWNLNEGAMAAICFVVLTLIVTASWYLIEQPLNRLKDRFVY